MRASPSRPCRCNSSRRLRSRFSGFARISRIARRMPKPTVPAPTAPRITSFVPGDICESWFLARGRRVLKRLGVVLKKLIQTLIGQRMIEQRIQDLEGHGPDVGAGF